MQEMQETLHLQGREDPLEEERATTPVFLRRESSGQKSLAGYSPWGSKESGMTDRLSSVRSFAQRALSPPPESSFPRVNSDDHFLQEAFLPHPALRLG